MPSTKEGLQRLLDFFVYGMLRASERLGNAPLFLRTIEEEGLRKFLTTNMPQFQAPDDPAEACRQYMQAGDEGGLFDGSDSMFRGDGDSVHAEIGDKCIYRRVCTMRHDEGLPVHCIRAFALAEMLRIGLDAALGGGFPVGHVLLISGLPGTMKSTLSYAILHGNARERGAKCLYISLEQTRKSLEAQMAAMGFDVEAVRADVHILDVGTIQKEAGKSATKPWMDFLRRTMQTKKDIEGVDLVVIDSLDALEVLAKFEDRRTDLFRFFEWLRDLGATTVILAEAASDAPFLGIEAPQPRRDETFLADGILELKMHSISDVEVQRRIRVVKMRGSHHKTGFSALVFEDGRFQVTSVISP